MDDLGHALAQGGDNLLMLEVGNPRIFLKSILSGGSVVNRLSGKHPTYVQWSAITSPLGSTVFRNRSRLLRSRYGWDLTLENVAITAGGQTAFSIFSMLSTGTLC